VQPNGPGGLLIEDCARLGRSAAPVSAFFKKKRLSETTRYRPNGCFSNECLPTLTFVKRDDFTLCRWQQWACRGGSAASGQRKALAADRAEW